MVDADIASIETELEDLATPDTPPATKKTPQRAPLPPELPRTEIHHDPEREHCECGCQRRRIGEEVSEKLDYTPGVFHVERHIRGKWVCDQYETLVQAPVPAQIIDKGIPTAGLLAQVNMPIIYHSIARSRPLAAPAYRFRLHPGGVGRYLRRTTSATDRCLT